MCSGRVGNSCSTNGTGHVNLVTNPVISRKLRNIHHSGDFWPEVTKSRDRKRLCPEVVLTRSRFCACPAFSPRFFLSSSTVVTWLPKVIWSLRGSLGCGHAQNPLPVMTTSGQGLLRSCDFVTSDQKAQLGRILRNFRLYMRITYFRTGSLPVTCLTSLPVMSLPVTWLTSLRSCAMVRSPANTNLSVPIYYSRSLVLCVIFVHLSICPFSICPCCAVRLFSYTEI
jgi:hypothetical protein